MGKCLLDEIPLGVIQQHLLPALNGFDLLNFTSTCHRYYDMLTYTEKLTIAFNSSNVVVAKAKSNMKKHCGCGEWVKQLPQHARHLHKVPATMICYCYKDDTHDKKAFVTGRCPLDIRTCRTCKHSGPVIDIAPWVVVLTGVSPFSKVREFRANNQAYFRGINYCVNCITHRSCQDIQLSAVVLEKINKSEYEITYSKRNGQWVCTAKIFTDERIRVYTRNGNTKEQALAQIYINIPMYSGGHDLVFKH